MTQRRSTTLKDIADRVGVSKMAVSAVLGRTASNVGVSHVTRGQILAAARELGYQPNAIARSLRSRRTNVIGFYSGYHYLSPRDPFVAEVLGGLQAGCTAHGKDLLLHTAFRGTSADEIYEALADSRIDGLILTAPPDDPLVDRLAASGLPAVAIADEIPRLPSVVVDDAAGARALVEHLAERGHQRFLFRSPNRYLVSAARRRDTVFQLAAEREFEVAEWRGPEAPCGESPLIRSWLVDDPAARATACLCWNDRAAYELLAHCHHLGVSVPQGLAVTGFDGDRQPLPFLHCLTTVSAPWAAVARLAVKLLVTRMEGDEVPRQNVLPVELVVGNTT